MVLQHDTLDSFYRYPQGSLTAGAQVRLRVAVSDGDSSADRVDLRVWDGEEHRFPMRLLGAREGKRYYEAQVTVCDRPCLYWYRFEVQSKGLTYMLGAPHDHTGSGEGRMGSEESFQITVYDPDFSAPQWMCDGIMYQIMVEIGRAHV